MMYPKFSDGFSLIELAIVLAILGVIGGIGLPLVSHFTDRSKQKVAVTHHEQVIRSLAGYVLLNKHLPYPADPAATGENFGKASAGRDRGLVPFKALGLDESVVKDGYGHFITYVVEPSLCQTNNIMEEGGSSSGSPPTGSPGSIPAGSRGTIDPKTYFCSEASKPYSLQTPRGMEPGFSAVLISHGPGGHGAYAADGTLRLKRASSAGVREEANLSAIAGSGKVFHKRPFSNNKENSFRHHVTAVTHTNLMAIYAQYPCRGEG